MTNKDRFDIESLIERELDNIEKLIKEIEQYNNEPGAKRLKGSILHDFYNSCERIFKWIARDINGDFNPTTQWHKELLFRMTVEIINVRPPVISEELAADLNEFLQFRHLFRNIYGFELKSDLLDHLVKKFKSTALKFSKETRDFLKALE